MTFYFSKHFQLQGVSMSNAKVRVREKNQKISSIATFTNEVDTPCKEG